MDTKNTISNVSELSPEQLKAIQGYATMIRQKHPGWSPKMVAKTVAEHFKIKLDYSGRNKRPNKVNSSQ